MNAQHNTQHNAQQIHMTPKQLAERLCRDEVTLISWRRAGRGPAFIRYGRTILYPVAEVEKWEQAHLVAVAPPQQQKDYLTTEELAARYGVSPSTLAHWRLRGDGPKFRKLGRQVRYPISQIEEFERLHQNSYEYRKVT